MTKREALLAMGYVERKSGVWLKPIGYQCFSYHEDSGMWASWIKDAQGKLCVYDSQTLKEPKDGADSYLNQIKGYECFTRTDLFINCDSHFELMVLDI